MRCPTAHCHPEQRLQIFINISLVGLGQNNKTVIHCLTPSLCIVFPQNFIKLYLLLLILDLPTKLSSTFEASFYFCHFNLKICWCFLSSLKDSSASCERIFILYLNVLILLMFTLYLFHFILKNNVQKISSTVYGITNWQWKGQWPVKQLRRWLNWSCFHFIFENYF